MDFAKANVVIQQAIDGHLRLFEFDGEVAGIVIDTEVRIEARITGILFPEAVEEIGGFDAVFEQTEWFGFEAQVKFAVSLLGNFGNVLDAAPKIGANQS